MSGQEQKQPVMVMLDLNGTIVYRTAEKVYGVREDLYVRRKFYYRRHGVTNFVKKLSKYFHVVVYSSIMKHNIKVAVNAIFPRRGREIGYLYDRTYNKPDPEAVNEWDTIRDMDKIFSHSGYGTKNTILLDNESRKFQDTPQNGIVVPEFGEQEVRDHTRGTLDYLCDYLLEMANDENFGKEEFDVRDYMEEHSPYESDSNSIDDITSALAETSLSEGKDESESSNKMTLARCSDVGDVGSTRMLFLKIADGYFVYEGDMKFKVKGKVSEEHILEKQMQLARIMKDLKDCELKVFYHDNLIEE